MFFARSLYCAVLYVSWLRRTFACVVCVLLLLVANARVNLTSVYLSHVPISWLDLLRVLLVRVDYECPMCLYTTVRAFNVSVLHLFRVPQRMESVPDSQSVIILYAVFPTHALSTCVLAHLHVHLLLQHNWASMHMPRVQL
jgi:hypothetical protein